MSGRRRRPDRGRPQEGHRGHRRPVPVHRQQHVAARHARARRSTARATSKDFVARLDDPRPARRCKAESRRRSRAATAASASRSPATPQNPKWQGKTIAAIAEAEKKEPIDIVLEIERNGGAQIVNFGMSEEDVRLYMKQPWVATASDGSVQTPGDTVPHPRSYGTFPRKIGHYAIEEKIIPLEHAIRSATGLPADILKLTDRGYLKAGLLRRRGRLRPEDVPRHGDVRQAAPVRHRREVGVRQRPRRGEGRGVSGRSARRAGAAVEEVRIPSPPSFAGPRSV